LLRPVDKSAGHAQKPKVILFRSIDKLGLLMPSLVLLPFALVIAKRVPPAVSCRFGPEYVVAASPRKLIDAVATVAAPERAWALWSDGSGLFGRALTLDGKPVGGAKRLGERCSGGFDAVYRPDHGIAVACSIRAQPGGDELGNDVHVRVLDERTLATRRLEHLGSVGLDGSGIDLSVHGDDVWVAWHEAAGDQGRVWLGQLDSGFRMRSLNSISDPGHIAGPPSVLTTRDGPWVTWTETWLDQGKLINGVMVYTVQGGARSVRLQAYREATPQLVDFYGKKVIAFRDRPARVRATGLYLATVSSRPALSSDPVRVARADGEASPALSACSGGLVVASPRTFGQERFIGVNWLNPFLNPLGAEQQFSENARDFVLAGSTCARNRTLLLIAERGSATQYSTNVRSVTYQCQ
jgi:hypothetical protein